MKATFLGIVTIGATILLFPGEGGLLKALRKSSPRPELEPYLRERLEREPANADLLREIIRIRRAANDRGGEIALRRRLAGMVPDDRANLEELMTLHLWDNQSEEAFALVSSLLQRDPDRQDLRELAVALLEYLGRPADAHAHAAWLKARGVRTPQLARIFLAARDSAGLRGILSNPRDRGQALVALGAQREAIAAYREHLDLSPEDVDSRAMLAHLYVWNGRPMEAAGELEICLNYRDDPDLRKELVSIYRSLHRIDLLLPHLPDGVEKADVLVALGRPGEARPLYRALGRTDKLVELAVAAGSDDDELAILAELPPEPDVLRRRADLLLWRQDFRTAGELYEKLKDDRALDLRAARGDLPGATGLAREWGSHRKLAQLLLWAGDVKGAIAEYELLGDKTADLARLYVQVGRREDAVRIIDGLEGDAYERASLYVYARRGDKAVALLRPLPPKDWEPPAVEWMARGADPDAAVALYMLLVERHPTEEKYLILLADLEEARGHREDLIYFLQELLALRPDNAGALGRLGLLLRDQKMLERALELGAQEPRILRELAVIARRQRRKTDAIDLYHRYLARKDDDPESHYALGELAGDAKEYERAWSLLAPDELRLRARILAWRGDLEGAERMLRQASDWEGLGDLLIRQKRYDEAAELPLSLRQRAVLALGRREWADAIRLLVQLDVTDPDIRDALAGALLALRPRQDGDRPGTDLAKPPAEKSPDPEGSFDYRYRSYVNQTQSDIEARFRYNLWPSLFFRVETHMLWLSGTVAALSDTRAVTVQEAGASANYFLARDVRAAVGVDYWTETGDSSAGGFAELEVRKPDWWFGLGGDFRRPWAETLEAAVAHSTQNAFHAGGSVSPATWLILGASLENRGYQVGDVPDAPVPLAAETASEIRARWNAEIVYWRGSGAAGAKLHDPTLLQQSILTTHLGVCVQMDYANLRGSQELLDYLQIAPRTEILALGPTGVWAGERAGVMGRAFVGTDPARNLTFGQLWGASVNGVLMMSDRFKFTSSFDFVNEQRQTLGGPSWAALVGMNLSF